MKLKVYQSKTLFDATENMLDECDFSDFQTQHIFVVPDKFSLQMEKLLLTKGQKAFFNVKVVGITSLAITLLNQFGKNCPVLSNSESLLLTQQAVENTKKDFLAFKKSGINFCYEMNKTISQLKSSCILPQDLESENENLTQRKYHDLQLIYNEYQRLKGDKLDANERLNLLTQNLNSNFANFKKVGKMKIYFAQFSSLTKEGINLLQGLFNIADEINFALAYADNVGNEYIYDNDLFYAVKKIASDKGQMIEVKQCQTKLNKNALAIANGLYSYDKVTCENDKFYFCYSVSSLTQEVNACAKLIYSYLNKGFSYNDFVIITSDSGKYAPQIESTFEMFNIPFYIDSSLSADKTYLGDLVLSLYDVVISGYAKENLISFFAKLKLNESQDVIEKILTFDVDGKMRYKKYISKMTSVDEIFTELEKAKTDSEFVKATNDFLNMIEESFNQFLQQLNEKQYLKEFQQNNQMGEILKQNLFLIESYNSKTNLGEFAKKMKLLLSFKSVSSVPAFCDSVFVGDGQSEILPSKVIIFLGGQNLPVMQSDASIFGDDELSLPLSKKVVEPSIRMINRRNRFKLFSLCTMAKEKLIVFYSVVSEDGKKNEMPTFANSLNSVFLSRTSRAFSVFDNVYSSNDDVFTLSLGNKNNVINSYYKNLNDFTLEKLNLKQSVPFENLKIEKSFLPNAKEVFFDKNYVRVTELEQYFSCPFKHFVSYALSLKPRKSMTLEVNDVGNVCHSAVEKYVKNLMQNDFVPEDVSRFIENNFDEILKEQSLQEIIENSPERESVVMFLKNQIRVILQDVQREILKTNFKPLFVEKKFDDLSLGKDKIKVVGKSDRIDKCGQFFRIIDYKTGRTGDIKTELYYGNKIQLFLYQKSMREKFNLVPGGVFYFNAKYEFLKNNEEKIILKGLAQSDNEVLSNLDTTLSDGEKSEILPLSITKKGAFSGSSIAKEGLNILENYAFNVSSRAVDEIGEGFIKPKPDEDACRWCKYSAICTYEKSCGVRKKEKIGDFTKLNGKESD